MQSWAHTSRDFSVVYPIAAGKLVEVIARVYSLVQTGHDVRQEVGAPNCQAFVNVYSAMVSVISVA